LLGNFGCRLGCRTGLLDWLRGSNRHTCRLSLDHLLVLLGSLRWIKLAILRDLNGFLLLRDLGRLLGMFSDDLGLILGCGGDLRRLGLVVGWLNVGLEALSL